MKILIDTRIRLDEREKLYGERAVRLLELQAHMYCVCLLSSFIIHVYAFERVEEVMGPVRLYASLSYQSRLAIFSFLFFSFYILLVLHFV